MRKTLAYAFGLCLISGTAVFGQQAQPDQWRIIGEHGETVHVLPGPAAVQAAYAGVLAGRTDPREGQIVAF